MAMRKRSEIMDGNSMVVSLSGGDSEDVNTRISIEILLDVRQILAGIFVIQNGGSLPTPAWLVNIAKGS